MDVIKTKWIGTALGGFFMALGLLPMAFQISILTFAWRASLYLGYWPRYSHPDPKDLPEHFQPSTEFMDYLIPWGVLILIMVAMVILIHRFNNPMRKLLFSIKIMAFSWFLCIIFFIIDPGGAVEWFLD
jgi:hypothetical protein